MQIRVVAKVSGHADSNQSNNAEYEIIPQTPVIAYQPQSATYRIDKEVDAINFYASVSDGGVLSYQWQSSSDGITYSDIHGETFSYFYPNTSVMNEWSGVFLEGSTRNGLTQDVHLNNLANSRRTDKLILEWYENNPNGTCQECSDATGISLRTVKKYHPGREKPYKPKKAAPKNQRIPKTCPDCGGELIKEIKGPWVCKVECCAQGRQCIKTKRICTQCGTVAYEKVSEYHEKKHQKVMPRTIFFAAMVKLIA